MQKWNKESPYFVRFYWSFVHKKEWRFTPQIIWAIQELNSSHFWQINKRTIKHWIYYPSALFHRRQHWAIWSDPEKFNRIKFIANKQKDIQKTHSRWMLSKCTFNPKPDWNTRIKLHILEKLLRISSSKITQINQWAKINSKLDE